MWQLTKQNIWQEATIHFLFCGNYRLWLQCVTSTAGVAHFLSATLDQRTGRIDARVRKKGQEELSLFMSTLDTICTRDAPLGLRSHITSTVCSPEMSHFLKLTREPLQSLAPLSAISLSLTPKDRPFFFFFAIMLLVPQFLVESWYKFRKSHLD